MIPNFNEDRGIHYGVISGHSVPSLVDDIFRNGENISYTRWCEECRNEIRSQFHPYDFKQSGETPEDRWDYMCDTLYYLGFYNPRGSGTLYDLFEQLEDDDDVSLDIAEFFIENAYDEYDGDEDNFVLSQNGTTVQMGWLGGSILIWVIDSDYKTWAKKCSPCVPGAGDLDNPTDKDSGFPCLSLPPSWYEDEKLRIIEELEYV